MSEVKVGQVWRCHSHGVEVTVDYISRGIIEAVSSAGYRYDMSVASSDWTLVQDAPETACNHYWGDRDACGGCGLTFEAFVQSRHPETARDMTKPYTAVTADGRVYHYDPMAWVTPKAKTSQVEACEHDWQASLDRCSACGITALEVYLRLASSPAPAPFQQSACSALCGTLPKSEQMYLEGSIGECEPAEQAINEVRRKASTLRSWPVCPVSQQPLSIEASVKEEGWPRRFTALACDPSSNETVRTWQAAFVCRTCGGGK